MPRRITNWPGHSAATSQASCGSAFRAAVGKRNSSPTGLGALPSGVTSATNPSKTSTSLTTILSRFTADQAAGDFELLAFQVLEREGFVIAIGPHDFQCRKIRAAVARIAGHDGPAPAP